MASMYVCSCNGLTDHDVRDAANSGARRTCEVYSHRQCRAQCGNCAPTVLCLLREALAAAQSHIQIGHASALGAQPAAS